MAYSDYGLDEVKRSEDEGTFGSFYCPWCKATVAKGFSLCFANFCICSNCLNKASELTDQWKPDDGNGCMKCKRGNKNKVYGNLFYDRAGGVTICKECIEWGKDVLLNQEKYFNNMVQEILQKCLVEGNVVKLPQEKIDRKVYLEVAKKLELIGGKWKGNKIQGFVFEGDPTELLKEIANGDDRNLKKEFQFFPTPKDIAEQMISYLPQLEPGAKVLEPSAGDGALIKAFRSAYPNITVDCFELMELNRKRLASVDGANLFTLEDFLKAVAVDEQMPSSLLHNWYDVIIANPPFTKNADIDHIEAMFKCLKPGGTIVTLCSPSWTLGSNKKQIQFKAWLDSLEVFPLTLPDKSFVSSGTKVIPLLLQIKKPAIEEHKLDAKIIDFGKARAPKDVDDGCLSQNLPAPDEDFEPEEMKCRVCGCTEDDCSQCIEKTGEACHWVDEDLCSACAAEASPTVQECDASKAEVVEELGQQKEESLPKPFDVHEDGHPHPHMTFPESAIILEQMIDNEKEIAGSLQELKTMLSPNTTDMNFFQQIYPLLDGIDLTLRLRRVNGQLKLEVLPQTGGTIRPAVIAGTPEDLDAGFFDAIAVPIQKAKGLKLEMDQFHQSTVQAKEDAAKLWKEATKAKDAAPKETKKAVEVKEKKPVEEVVAPAPIVKKEPAKQKVQEPALFD